MTRAEHMRDLRMEYHSLWLRRECFGGLSVRDTARQREVGAELDRLELVEREEAKERVDKFIARLARDDS